MTPERHTQIQQLLTTYCQETGIQLRLNLCDYSREFALNSYLDAGFTADDLAFLVRHLKRQISRGERRPGCLRFSTLVGDLSRFDEELAMALAQTRKPVVTPKEKALKELRPQVTETVTNNTRTAGQVSEAALRLLRECKAQL